jgi:phage shock protein A
MIGMVATMYHLLEAVRRDVANLTGRVDGLEVEVQALSANVVRLKQARDRCDQRLSEVEHQLDLIEARMGTAKFGG